MSEKNFEKYLEVTVEKNPYKNNAFFYYLEY